MKTNLKIIIVLCISIFSLEIYACAIPPKMTHSHNIIIDEAQNIVLAKAVSFKPPKGKAHTQHSYQPPGAFKFKTEKILKGNAPNNFYIKAYKHETPNTLWTSILKYTFSYFTLNHDYDYFWKNKFGRSTSNNSMCIIVPDFSINSTYLIIEGRKQDSKNYELITFSSDKWLSYVKNRLEIIEKN